MPDFFVGMLEGASPKARFINGNENAYYYTSREQYFRAYHAIRRRALGLVPAELRENTSGRSGRDKRYTWTRISRCGSPKRSSI